MARKKPKPSPLETEIEKLKSLDKKFICLSKTLSEKRRDLKKRVRTLQRELGIELEKKSPQLRLFDL